MAYLNTLFPGETDPYIKTHFIRFSTDFLQTTIGDPDSLQILNSQT